MPKAKANSDEFQSFQRGMTKLLKADPSIVKAAMEREKRERAEERKTKRASSAPSSSSHDV